MKIAVTDAWPFNPGDLNWEHITAFGELIVYERTPAELIIESVKKLILSLPIKFHLPKIF